VKTAPHDMHNLFGDTNSINVVMTRDGGYRLEEVEPGDRIDQLLEYVHYDPRQLLARYKVKLERTRLSEAEKQQYYLELAAGLSGYSYLED
jgi:arginine decarboxylase